jgi:hypothetical protein
VIKLRGQRYVSYAEKFIPPFAMAFQDLSNGFTNVRRFLSRDFHMKSGMKHLIESFYQSITGDVPVPIPYREILLTAHIMERIFGQIKQSSGVGPLSQRADSSAALEMAAAGSARS